MRLTDLSIKTLKAPPSGVVIYSDSTLTGFGVRVSTGGTKSFVLTHGVRRQRETIGKVGILSLQEARSEAKRRLAEYTLGKTPASAITWKAAVEEFLAFKAARRKERTVRSYRYILNRHFRFGETKCSDLKPTDLAQKLRKIAHLPAEHHHAYAVVRTFTEWAYRQYYFEHRPLDRMTAPPVPPSRDRVLTRAELAAVFQTAFNGEAIFDHIVATLVLTGQRRTQISNLRDEWLQQPGFITIPKIFTKHIEHKFPIGPLTNSVIDRTPRIAADPHVFPALRDRRAGQPATVFNAWGNSKAAFDRRLKDAGYNVAPWTLHDLRRTFRTFWAELGIRREVAEKYIHHISGVHSGVDAIYNRHSYMTEMRDAVQRWEDFLKDLTADPSNFNCTTLPQDYTVQAEGDERKVKEFLRDTNRKVSRCPL